MDHPGCLHHAFEMGKQPHLVVSGVIAYHIHNIHAEHSESDLISKELIGHINKSKYTAVKQESRP